MSPSQLIHFVVSEAVRFVTPVGIAAEWVLVAISLLLVLVARRILRNPLSKAAAAFDLISRDPRKAGLCCVILPIFFRSLLLPFIPVPEPSIHDEFSHLLLADTLARGRLTNPTPVMWTHFETIHVIQKPTYNSMYLPAQAIFLAAGEILFHEPWAGVELGIACMCLAMYWMYRAYIPLTWALFGVVVVILKLSLVGFWVNSYMGGAVPAIGGALVVGALPRLQRNREQTSASLLLGFGAVILMGSRPFEGGILTAIVVSILAWSLRRELRVAPAQVLRQVAAPAAAVLLIGAAGMSYYCWRVTGHATEMPYQVNRATYGWPENLAFLPPKKISLEHPVLQRMYELEVSRRAIYDSAQTLIDNLATRLFDNWAYLIGPVLTIPLVFGFLSDDPRARVLKWLLVAVCAVNIFQLVLYPYHLAPVVPILYCLVAIGCQAIFQALRRLEVTKALCFAAVVPLCLVAVDGLKQYGDEIDVPVSSYWERGYELQRDARTAVVQWLQRRPGKHLVIVRYTDEHSVNQEWVYNGADLNGSKILWARDMGEKSNEELLRYYSKRHAWLVEADVSPQRVVPYPDPLSNGATASPCSPCCSATR